MSTSPLPSPPFPLLRDESLFGFSFNSNPSNRSDPFRSPITKTWSQGSSPLSSPTVPINPQRVMQIKEDVTFKTSLSDQVSDDLRPVLEQMQFSSWDLVRLNSESELDQYHRPVWVTLQDSSGYAIPIQSRESRKHKIWLLSKWENNEWVFSTLPSQQALPSISLLPAFLESLVKNDDTQWEICSHTPASSPLISIHDSLLSSGGSEFGSPLSPTRASSASSSPRGVSRELSFDDLSDEEDEIPEIEESHMVFVTNTSTRATSLVEQPNPTLSHSPETFRTQPILNGHSIDVGPVIEEVMDANGAGGAKISTTAEPEKSRLNSRPIDTNGGEKAATVTSLPLGLNKAQKQSSSLSTAAKIFMVVTLLIVIVTVAAVCYLRNRNIRTLS